MSPIHGRGGDGVRLPSGLLAVGLGETLFDCFPETTILGGAPVNFAVYAHALLSRFGGSAAPATRVGSDPLADRFFGELAERAVATSGVQVDQELPTGRVLVEVDDDGQASYRFEDNVAWDRLEWTDNWKQLAKACDAVSFGTLAQRSETSQQTIFQFVGAASEAIRVFDVNLRGDFYSASALERSLQLASAVKLNEEELTEVCGLLDLSDRRKPDADQQAGSLGSRFDLDWLAVTRGAAGTVLYVGDQRFEGIVPRVIDRAGDADSVGAGDACCASLVTGMLLGWEPKKTLELANHVGAFVASQPGATPRLTESALERIGVKL